MPRPTAPGSDIHALLVAVNLLRQGFAVFRKMGQASPCDLMIVQRRRCWRLAVRTARYPRVPIHPKAGRTLVAAKP